MIGVVVSFYTNFTPSLIVLVAVLSIASLGLFAKLNKFSFINLVSSASIFLFFLLLGSWLSGLNNSKLDENYFGKHLQKSENSYLFRITEVPQVKENSVKCEAKILSMNGQQVIGNSLVYVEKDTLSLQLNYGDIIEARGYFNAIKPNGNPDEFDYSRYLRIHDIHHQAYLTSDNWMKVGEDPNQLLASIFNIREYFNTVLDESGMSDENLMVSKALLLGEKEFLDKEILRTYSSAGAMHVLAVSGLHVGIIMLILTFVFSPIKKVKRGKILFITLMLLGIWFYAIITGLSPSVMRAAFMFSFVVLGKEIQRDTSIYQSILVSAFILILIEPYIIFQVGFQLSYLAVLGIVFLQPKIYNLFFVKNYLLNKAWQISSVSIAAQLATFPLGVYYFHQFPNFFLISNLLVIPLAFVLLIVGISFLVLHLIPYLGDLLLLAFDFLMNVLNIGVKWVEALPYSIIWGLSIQWYEAFLMYIILFFGSMAFVFRKKKMLMMSLGMTVLLCTISMIEKIQMNQSNEVVFYNVKNSIAIDVFNGSQNTFIADQELYGDESKLLFHVKHHWFRRSGNENPVNYIDSKSVNFFRFGENSCCILTDESMAQNEDFIPLADYYYLSDISYIPIDFIEKCKNYNSQFILGGGLPFRTKSFLSSAIPSSQLVDLSETGALIIDF